VDDDDEDDEDDDELCEPSPVPAGSVPAPAEFT
jgi:hypothetical protein